MNERRRWDFGALLACPWETLDELRDGAEIGPLVVLL
jgi:hypothetical protein